MHPIAEARGFSSSGCADQDVSLGRSSHTINACLVQICQGQNRLGGVPVTVGGAPLAVIKEYVANQKDK